MAIRSASRQRNRPDGSPILPEALYSAQAVKAATGIGPSSFRELLANVPHRWIGSAVYVRGSDLIDWLWRCGKPQSPWSNPQRKECRDACGVTEGG